MNKKARRVPTNSENLRSRDRGIVEDSTLYGEFIPSFDAWLPIEEQKKNAEYMERLGD